MVKQSELLTGKERELLSLLGRVADGFIDIVSTGVTREEDLRDAFAAIHVLQRMVASQCAGRVFPVEYRLLGSTIQGTKGQQS